MPLNSASRDGHLDIVKYLFEECYCNSETNDNEGRTALHLASANGYFDIVKYLVEECHCNAETKDNNGKTPLDVTCSWNSEIKEYLRNKQ